MHADNSLLGNIAYYNYMFRNLLQFPIQDKFLVYLFDARCPSEEVVGPMYWIINSFLIVTMFVHIGEISTAPTTPNKQNISTELNRKFF